MRYNSTSYADPCLKMRETPLLSLLQLFYLSKISIAELENTGLQKRTTFATLISGPAETGDRTRATCVAGSGIRHSAIPYDFLDSPVII
jgi:hypothetical protein